MKIYMAGNDVLEWFDEQEDPMIAPDKRDESRENLARWLARYCERRDCDAVLVFDGTEAGDKLPLTRRVGRVTVLNAPYGVDARTEIAGPANRSAVRERTLVVTADRRTIEALEHGKATVQRPDEFVPRARSLMGKDTEALAAEPDEKFGDLTDDEVDFWLDYFDADR